jgi:hypothetical protein
VEAYPIDTSIPGSTRNVFTGTVHAFERAGFTVVARLGASRAVMRYDLTGRS